MACDDRGVAVRQIVDRGLLGDDAAKQAVANPFPSRDWSALNTSSTHALHAVDLDSREPLVVGKSEEVGVGAPLRDEEALRWGA